MRDREPYERDAGELKSPPLIVTGLGDGRVEGVEQELRALSGHRGDQRVLVREVVVGRRHGDAGATGDVAQRQSPCADLGQGVQRGGDQRLAQITMVVRALAADAEGCRPAFGGIGRILWAIRRTSSP